MVWSISLVGSIAIGVFNPNFGLPLGDSFEVWLYLREGCVDPVRGHSRLGFVNAICDIQHIVSPVLAYASTLLLLVCVAMYLLMKRVWPHATMSPVSSTSCIAACSAIPLTTVLSFLSVKELIACCATAGIISGIYSGIKIYKLVLLFLFLSLFLAFRSPLYLNIIVAIAIFSLVLSFVIPSEIGVAYNSVRNNSLLALIAVGFISLLPLEFGGSTRVGIKILEATASIAQKPSNVNADKQLSLSYMSGCEETKKGSAINDIMNYFDKFIANSAKSGRGKSWDEKACIDSRNFVNSPQWITLKALLSRTVMRFYGLNNTSNLLLVLGFIAHICTLVGLLIWIFSLTTIGYGAKCVVAVAVFAADFIIFFLLGSLFPNTSTVYRYSTVWLLSLGLISFCLSTSDDTEYH